MSQIQAVANPTTYYLLLCDMAHVEVGVEFVKLDGGAGYVWEAEDREYIVLSIYKTRQDVELVFKNLDTENGEYFVQAISTDRLYFKGKEKKKSGLYLSALNTLRGYLDVVMGCAVHLDTGQPQERVKRILSASEKQLIFLSNQYKEEYADFSDLCDGVAILLQDVNSENVIYARDLRYIACTIADGYIHLCQAFSL